MKNIFRALVFALTLMGMAGIAAADTGPLGIKVGAGTDFKGFAGGGGLTYLLSAPGSSIGFEIGTDCFFHNSTATGTSDDHFDWTETTTLIVGLAKFNGVFGYEPGKAGPYAVAGTGVVVASVDWKETGKGTTGYTYLSPYTYTFSGVGFGTVINPGFGYAFNGGLELRVEAPMMVFFGNYGTAAFAPAVTGNLIFRFPK
jgi:hypothetical protein